MLKPEIENKVLRHFASLIYRGVTRQKAADIVLKRHEEDLKHVRYSKANLMKKWRNRGEWLYDVFDLNEENILEQVLTEQLFIKSEFYSLYDEAETIKDRRLILKDIKNMNLEYLDILVDMGVIERQPNKLEITGSGGGALEISSLAKVADEWETINVEDEKHLSSDD